MAGSDTRWLRERLTGPKDTLHEFIPAGFRRYARIFQPGWAIVFTAEAWKDFPSGHEERHATPVSWSAAAAASHRVPHRQMQWGAISRLIWTSRGLADCEPVLGGRTVWPPNEGTLPRDMVDSLFSILARHTPAGSACGYAYWTGFGGKPLEGVLGKLDVGSYDYAVLQAPLAEIHALMRVDHNSEVHGPNLLWPLDASWCLSLPFHRDSTYLGGSEALLSDVLACDCLETFEAFPGDDLWHDPLNERVV